MSADLALSYATLILVDAKQDLSESNLEKLVTKAGVKLPKGLSAAYAKAVKGKDISAWFAVGGGGASSAPAAATSAPTAAKAEPKVEAKPAPPPEEEADVDMGGLFDF